jgi:PAS domain S-box-containing protein
MWTSDGISRLSPESYKKCNTGPSVSHPLFVGVAVARAPGTAMTSSEVGPVRFEQFFMNSSDLMAVADADGNFLLLNGAFKQILGWQPEELIGQSYTSIIHPDDLDFVKSSFQAKDGVVPSAVELELRERCADGQYRWMKWTIRRDGDLYYSVGHDISLRKETMSALADSIEKSRAIFDAAVDSIIVLDENLRVIEASPSNDTFFSFSKEETEGHHAMDFVHPDDRAGVLEAIAHGFATNETVRISFRGLRTDGQWVDIESRGRALRDAEGNPTGAVMISRDVTESVEAASALEVAKEEAERANLAKSEFMSRMSHELRTPLNSVLGFAQILQMEMSSAEELELIGYIVKSGGYLLELINEVLDISRVESGSIAVELEVVSSAELTRQCVEMVNAQALEFGVTIIDNCDDDHYVRADFQRLKQVLVNLLSNAIKYNYSGGTVTLDCVDVEGRMRLSVTDTGPGVAPQLHDRLFAPFDRLDAESRGIEGTGLGLALSKGLMEAIGGSLGVDSTPGTGSTFWLELPIASAGPSTPESDGNEEQLEPPVGVTSSATLLYIEDNIGNVRLIERLLLHRPNVRLLSSLQGSLGVELAQQHRPDLILLDVHLPDLPGIDVLEKLRRDDRTSSIPVIMLSADASQEQIKRFNEAGAKDYLTKPLDLEYFLTLLDSYLREIAHSRDAVSR